MPGGVSSGQRVFEYLNLGAFFFVEFSQRAILGRTIGSITPLSLEASGQFELAVCAPSGLD
jgi:hypothetical protein